MLWLVAGGAVLAVWLLARRGGELDPDEDEVRPTGSGGGGGGGSRAVDAEPSAEVYSAIVGACQSHGLPHYFGLANAAMESRFRPAVGLDTLGGVPEHIARHGAVPERSIGLMGINVNPNTPTGRGRIATIKRLRNLRTDAEVVQALRDPGFNAAFWAGHIVVPTLTDRARARYTGDDVWRAVRVWLAAMTLSPEGEEGQRRIRLFNPTLEKWKTRTFGV